MKKETKVFVLLFVDLIISIGIILFYVGRGFQDWQTTKLATENQHMRQVIFNTQKLLNQVQWNEQALNAWGQLGYRLTPIQPDTTKLNNL